MTEEEYEARNKEARHRLGKHIIGLDVTSGARSRLDDIFIQTWLGENGMTIEIGSNDEVTLGFSLSYKCQHLLREHLEARMKDIYDTINRKV